METGFDSDCEKDKTMKPKTSATLQRTRGVYGPERLQEDLADHNNRVGVHRIKRIRLGYLSPVAFVRQYYKTRIAA